MQGQALKRSRPGELRCAPKYTVGCIALWLLVVILTAYIAWVAILYIGSLQHSVGESVFRIES